MTTNNTLTMQFENIVFELEECIEICESEEGIDDAKRGELELKLSEAVSSMYTLRQLHNEIVMLHTQSTPNDI